jgi:hypothetical protein
VARLITCQCPVEMFAGSISDDSTFAIVVGSGPLPNG